MIVVRVEIWPWGFERDKRQLATAVIGNDGTGNLKTGNYNFYVGKNGVEDPHEIVRLKTRRWKTGRVENFRRSAGVWRLLRLALDDALEKSKRQ